MIVGLVFVATVAGLLALTTGGPSVSVTGWVATLIIVAGCFAAIWTIMRVAWPTLKLLVKIEGALPHLQEVPSLRQQVEENTILTRALAVQLDENLAAMHKAVGVLEKDIAALKNG